LRRRLEQFQLCAAYAARAKIDWGDTMVDSFVMVAPKAGSAPEAAESLHLSKCNLTRYAEMLGLPIFLT
jgi:hypothetical protein